MEYVPANEVESDDIQQKKSPVSQRMEKMADTIKAQKKEIERLQHDNDRNFSSATFKPRSKKSPITFSYGDNRIAYWKDGYWYDNETDEEVPDKWTGKTSPNYKKTSNEGAKEND